VEEKKTPEGEKGKSERSSKKKGQYRSVYAPKENLPAGRPGEMQRGGSRNLGEKYRKAEGETSYPTKKDQNSTKKQIKKAKN